MSAWRSVPLVALLLATGAADASSLQFRGYAYDLESHRHVYTELHHQHIAGERWLGGTIEYYAPDGTRLGRKTLDFSRDPYVPVFRLTLAARGGYWDGIEAVTDTRIDMIRKDREGGARTMSAEHSPRTVADAGLHVFIRDHFTELLSGRTVPFRFAVAGNLDTYKFRARRIGESTFEGRPAVRLRIEPASLLRWVVPPLELTYEPEQRKLVEYRGISDIRDPASGSAYHVRILYPSTPPPDVPALVVPP